MIHLELYKTEMGICPFEKWIRKIRSNHAKSRIFKALNKMEAGLLSDIVSLGGGVQEYRIHFEKGYRIYFANDGENLIVLLAGSDKKDQAKEIENAKSYWLDYKRQKAEKEERKEQK